MHFYAVNMTWSRATCMDKLKQYVHTFRRCNYDCDFKIDFELITLHLKGESALYIVLTNELMNESVSTLSDAS